MQDQLLLEFRRVMRHERVLERCVLHLKQVLAIHYQIHVFSFTYYTYYPGSPNKLKYDVAADFLLLWHKHYIEQGYDKIDSTLSWSTKTNLPIIWTLEEQLANAQSDLERQMREDSIAYGVERGISIPIHGPDGDYAEMVVQQRFGETCLAQSQLLQFDIMLIAHIYYENIKRILSKQAKQYVSDNKYNLSQREMQCLTLAAQRYSVEEIATAMSITPRTVNFHFQRINKKLGTKNKYHSLAKASAEHLINL